MRNYSPFTFNTILLIKSSSQRYYELDLDASLRENLRNKVIIEYPTIYVVLKHCKDDFDLMDSGNSSVCTKFSINHFVHNLDWFIDEEDTEDTNDEDVQIIEDDKTEDEQMVKEDMKNDIKIVGENWS